MAASLSGEFNFQQFTDAGDPLASGRVYTYTAGTTTKKTAYTDAAGSVAHTYTSDGAGGEYIALNARGELPAPLFLNSGSYDIALKRSDGTTVWTRRAKGQDDDAATLRTDLADTADAAKGDALIGTKASGTGAIARTQHAKNADFVYASDYDTLPNAVAAASGKTLRLTDGATYDITSTLSLTGLKGLVGAAAIRWNGTNNFNGYLLDASENSGIMISGAPSGELQLRCDTPAICRHGIKMGGGSISTFQSVLDHVVLIGAVGSAGASIAVDGGPSASLALNDGVFRDVRVDGFDIGYQVSAPDNKWFAGTIRVQTGGSFGIGIKAINNTKISVFGLVVSQARYALQLGHGIWGAACYGCWFEGITAGMILMDTALSEILGDVSFYSCRFDTDTPAVYLFDLDNWRPGSLINAGYFRIVGGDIHSINFTSAIRLHNDATRFPLTVHVDGFQDILAPIVWSGNTSRVSRRGAAAMTIGGVGDGIARHFTHFESALAWASIPAHDRDTRTATVTGVRTADQATVVATPVDLPANGLVWLARISADNTVQLIMTNTTTGAITPATMNWRFDIFTH